MRPHLRLRARGGDRRTGSRWAFPWRRPGRTGEQPPATTSVPAAVPPSTPPGPSSFERGLQLFDERHYEQALECFSSTLATDSGNEAALRKKAAALLRLRRLDEARRVLDEGLRAHPESPGLLTQLNRWAFLKLKAWEIPQALQAFQRTLSVRPKDRAALAGRIASLWQAGRLMEARDALDTALSLFPHSLYLHRELNRLGATFLMKRQYGPALASFERMLGFDAAERNAFLGKASSQWLLGQREDARRTVDAALALWPRAQFLDGLHQLGQTLSDSDPGSISELVLSVDPRHAPALVGRAESLRGFGRLDEAGKLLEEARTANPDLGPRLEGEVEALGIAYLALDRYDQALKTCERLLTMAPRDPAALAVRAITLQLLGNATGARNSVDPARTEVPLNDLLGGLLRVGRKLEAPKPKNALVAYELALEVDPKHAAALTGRADVLLVTRGEEAYRKAIDEALLLQPDDDRLRERLLRLAARDYNEGRYDRALDAFERILSLVHDHTFALRWRAASLRSLGVVEKAEAALAEAVASHPEDTGLLLQQGLTFRHLRRFPEALAAFDKASASVSPPVAEVVHAKADCLRRLHRYKEASTLLDEALTQPGYVPESRAWLLHDRALIFWDTREFLQAEGALAEVMAAAPYWFQPALERAEMLVRLGRTPEAQELIDALESGNPGSRELQHDIGWYHLQCGDFGKARARFDALPQGTADWETGQGAVCFHRDEYAAADGHFVRARALSPWNSVFITNIAWTLVNQEEPSLRPRAESLCREALVLTPEYWSAIECLGVIAAREGRLRDAEDRYLEAIRVSPSHGAYSNLGALYVQEGRHGEAREQLDLALQFDPNDTSAWIELGNLHWQLEDKREALQALRRAVAIAPDTAEPYRALGLALLRAGECTEAEKLLRRGLRRVDGPRSWRIHLALAQVLRSIADRGNDTGLYEEARQEVQAALRLREDDELWFELGYIQWKLDDLDAALAAFLKCGEDHIDAKRNAAKLRSTINERRAQVRGGDAGKWFLGTATIAQVLLVWFLFLDKRIEVQMVLTFIPILLALFVVALLLPWLIRLKLPGVEAELSQPKQSLSSGPSGGITLSSSMPTIARSRA